MKEPLKYQSKAIESLENRFNLYIREEGSHFTVLKATMGSGKTYIMSKLIQRICENEDLKDLHFVFIWATIGEGKLHEQSYRAVKEECGGFPACFFLNQYVESNNSFGDRQIYFVDWESIVNKNANGDWINKSMKDREKSNLRDLIFEAHEMGYKIVLIVDESHIGKKPTTRISEFRNSVLNPDFTFEVSATPVEKIDENRDVVIKDEDVKKEHMIKQGLKLNANIGAGDDDALHEGRTSLVLILSKAEEQREKIAEAYKKEGSNVNPLVLVQIPNSDPGNEVKNTVETFLRELKKPITRENGKLKVWLNDDKLIDEKLISQNGNEAEYLIFKTAIQNGWDCPRAHILVKFRDGKQPTPLIQTIGRINRTTERKLYDDDILNYGYIYTNMKDFSEDDIRQLGSSAINIFVKVAEGKDKTVDGVKSFFKPLDKEKNELSGVYIDPIIDSELCSEFGISETNGYLDDVLDMTKFTPKTKILTEKETTLEEIENGDINTTNSPSINTALTPTEIDKKIGDLIHKNCNGLSSKGDIRTLRNSLVAAIINHSKFYGRDKAYPSSYNLICKYEDEFGEIINRSTLHFKNLNNEKSGKGHYEDYQIPGEREYSTNTYKQLYCPLSLYDKMYVPISGSSELENEFVSYLSITFADKIEWIWHNDSEHSDKNFGIEIDQNENIFRPDFLIKFKNGMIGIFDTKTSTNHDIEDTRKKANALYKYLNNVIDAKSNIFGGIITEHNDSFYINQKENYENYDSSPFDYEKFDDIINKYVKIN